MAINITPLLDALQAKLSVESDVYKDNVELLLKTNGAITDQSSNSRPLTLRGDVTQSSVQTKYASQSIYFDGTGDGIDVFDIPLIGTQQFTIEFWMYPDNPSGIWQTLVSNEYNAAGAFRLYKTNASTELSWYNGSAALINTSGAGLASQWHHIAVCRDATNTTRVFVDGNVVGSASDTTDYGVLASSPVSIGLGNTTYESSEYPYEGYMEDLRITIGVARYTSTFTPPSKSLVFQEEFDGSLTELNALNYLATYASNTNNVIRYPTISFLNIEGTGDSADSYTGDFGYDISNNNYYFRAGFQWNELTLNDSAAVNQIPNVGKTSGFVIGGFPASNVIDSFPFASDGDNAVSLTTLNTARYQLHAGNDATTCVNVAGSGAPGTATDTCEQFSFASPSVSVNLSGLGNSRRRGISNHTVKGAKGYMSGGLTFPSASTSDSRSYNIVTSGSISGTSIGTLTAGARISAAGWQSEVTAYIGGGYNNPSDSGRLSFEKFPFATETLTSISPGTLSQTFNDAAAIYDKSKGIIQSGSKLEEIPFASETSSALPTPGIPSPFVRSNGTSYPVAGYFSSSLGPSDRFRVPFASGVATSTGGSLTVNRHWAVGQHN